MLEPEGHLDNQSSSMNIKEVHEDGKGNIMEKKALKQMQMLCDEAVSCLTYTFVLFCVYKEWPKVCKNIPQCVKQVEKCLAEIKPSGVSLCGQLEDRIKEWAEGEHLPDRVAMRSKLDEDSVPQQVDKKLEISRDEDSEVDTLFGDAPTPVAIAPPKRRGWLAARLAAKHAS